MLAARNKISIRQASFIFLTVIASPIVRFVPRYATNQAKQAAWLAPIISVVMLAVLVLVWNKLYQHYQDSSLMDIYSDISGKFIGKVLVVIYLLWDILLIVLYLRYFAERLLMSVFPNDVLSIFMISMLLVVAYALHSGLVTLARANEIILPILNLGFLLICVMLLPIVKLENLTPITYRDILPTFSASIGITALLSYYSFIFIIGDLINNKENIKKTGVQLSAYLFFILTLLMVSIVGTLSYTIAGRTSLPFFTAVKLISLFNTLEKVESLATSLWIMSDFILISFFTICALRLMKSLFNFNEEKPLINVFMVFVYFGAMYLCNNVFELEKFSTSFVLPGNIILGFGVPIFMLILGKLRKKI